MSARKPKASRFTEEECAALDDAIETLQQCSTLVSKVHRILRERDIERHLVRRVKELGGEVRKVVWPGRRGAPDRLVMLGLDRATKRLAQALMDEHSPALADELLVELLGLVLVWPELKAPGIKPESHQLREHERMRAMGQRVVVIDSIEGVEGLLS